MRIQILHLLEGAEQASGLTVIIDVFRAFTLEAYLFSQGAEKIYPVAALDQAFAMKQAHPEYLLFGERQGIKVEGCDYGNSPSSVATQSFMHRTMIHSTSAGTQGIMHAVHAQEILAGSFVNAKATAEYIRQRNPETVSLVAMGLAGEKDTEEDVLCAEYLRSLLINDPITDIDDRLLNLRYQEGKKFFRPEEQYRFPEGDFWMCIKRDIFDFVIHCEKEGNSLINRAVFFEE